MQEVKFKVASFKNDSNETRYRVISEDTEEILDDAQGYGYKTIQKAYAAYGYKIRKTRDVEKEEKTKEIKLWLKEHKGFSEFMEQVAFEIAKGSWGPEDKFDAKLVQEMLDNQGLKPNFTANQLLRVWLRK